jgi:hypothetical protein
MVSQPSGSFMAIRRSRLAPYPDAVDLVFVDGAHYYAAVGSDTRNALRMARSGGWIVWHDFANYGDYNDVTRAMFDLLPADQIVQLEDTQLAVFRNRQLCTTSIDPRLMPERSVLRAAGQSGS